MPTKKQEAKYAKLCVQCSIGKEPTRREVVPGTFLWLHDSVVTCGANEEREADKNKAAIKAQKAK